MPEDLYLDIQGVKIHLLKGGSGPPLLYWHGAGGCFNWHPHHALLAEHFTVYAPDHPGWGGSEGPEWMDTIHDYTLHNDALIRKLGLEKPLLIGHSLGGWMAADFAATYPDRLRALVLVNSAGFPFEADAAVPDFFAAASRGGSHFAQLIFHKMDVAQAFFPAEPTPEEILTNFRHLTSTARIAWHIWFDEKLPQRLARIECPTLALWGKHDNFFPASMAQQFADCIPGARVQIVEDSGHMLPFENPQALVDAVLALEGVAPSTPASTEGETGR
jgi:pimeloyl-ACP methyl ester carboxylesterase